MHCSIVLRKELSSAHHRGNTKHTGTLSVRLMRFLQDQVRKKRPDGQDIQLIVSTHSLNLASEIELDKMVILKNRTAFSLFRKHRIGQEHHCPAYPTDGASPPHRRPWRLRQSHLTEFRTCFTHMVHVFPCRKTGDGTSLYFSDDLGFAAALSNLATRDDNGTSKHSDNSLT